MTKLRCVTLLSKTRLASKVITATMYLIRPRQHGTGGSSSCHVEPATGAVTSAVYAWCKLSQNFRHGLQCHLAAAAAAGVRGSISLSSPVLPHLPAATLQVAMQLVDHTTSLFSCATVESQLSAVGMQR
jgi:hypothetical protein